MPNHSEEEMNIGNGGAGGPGVSRSGTAEELKLPCGHTLMCLPLEGITSMNCPECGKSFTLGPGKVSTTYTG
jgi:hypothetical protein